MNEDERAAETELTETWAGITLLEELRDAEMRELVSRHLAAGTTGRKALAAELGITRHRLDAFVDGGKLGAQERPGVAKWCEGKPRPHVSPYVVAIGVLCRWFPARFARTGRRMLWEYVQRMAETQKVELPRSATAEIDALYPLGRRSVRGAPARQRATDW